MSAPRAVLWVWLPAALCIPVVPLTLVGQSPRTADPERPSVATHAYAVAPGYFELEQGVRSAGGITSWEFNLKIGLDRSAQLGLFGTGFEHTTAASGVGDLGVGLKLRRDVGHHAAAAIIPAITLPTGSSVHGFGAGQALGSLVGVVSVDFPHAVHVDWNAGAMGIGAGKLQAFGDACVSWRVGRWTPAVELYDITAGGAGPRQAGLLGAVSLTVVEWLVLDGGGVAGLGGSANQAFLGVTANLGRVFD
jgi:hypothetical protein